MLNTVVRLRESAYRLRNNERGVVSFEYVIVAFCIVTAVGFAFGTTTGGNVATKLTSAINTVLGLLT